MNRLFVFLLLLPSNLAIAQSGTIYLSDSQQAQFMSVVEFDQRGRPHNDETIFVRYQGTLTKIPANKIKELKCQRIATNAVGNCTESWVTLTTKTGITVDIGWDGPHSREHGLASITVNMMNPLTGDRSIQKFHFSGDLIRGTLYGRNGCMCDVDRIVFD